MKILLVGAASLLGKKIWETVPKKFQIVPTFYHHAKTVDGIELDITQKKDVDKLVNKTRPQIIIHTSSLGDVDFCEMHQKKAWQVNVEGTKNLVSAAKNIQSRLIFFSSNAIFDGVSPPYDESSYTHPLNFYGKTKVVAEKIVHKFFPQAIIFRLTTMYGWNNPGERKNPATWLIDRLQKNLPTPIVTDVYNNHLWVGQAAKAVWQVINLKKWGELFHIAGKNCMNRYDFAINLSRVFKLDEKLLRPVTSDYFLNLTPRAHNTCFRVQKMERELKIIPVSLIDGLNLMKKDKS